MGKKPMNPIEPSTTRADLTSVNALVILHTNDIHGHIEEAEQAQVRFGQLEALLAQRKREHAAVLLLDAGDALHGSVSATLSRGEAVLNWMTRLGYDAMTLGNHDFNYGYSHLKQLQDAHDIPFLAGNVCWAKSGAPLFDGLRVFDWPGLRVGIFGLATPETQIKSNPNNTKGLRFADAVAYATDCVHHLRQGGADVIIALSHLGMDAESHVQDKQLAELVPGIDVIVGGHSHHQYETGITVGRTLIVQAGCHLSAVGEVVLTREDNGRVIKKACLHTAATLADQTSTIKPHRASSMMRENAPFLAQPLGFAVETLQGERLYARAGETNFGSLMADVMRAETGSEVAIMNGGGLRCSIPRGLITMREVVEAFPFTNHPVLLEVSGKVLWAALEHGVSVYPSPGGRFPQVSGLYFEADVTQAPGRRIQSVWVGKRRIQRHRRYRLAVNDFMAAGGDGYDMFREAMILDRFPPLSEVLAKHIRSMQQVPAYREQRMRLTALASEQVVHAHVPHQNAHPLPLFAS